VHQSFWFFCQINFEELESYGKYRLVSRKTEKTGRENRPHKFVAHPDAWYSLAGKNSPLCFRPSKAISYQTIKQNLSCFFSWQPYFSDGKYLTQNLSSAGRTYDGERKGKIGRTVRGAGSGAGRTGTL
jgi:hypothetical protein